LTPDEHGPAHVLETVAVPSCLDEVHALFGDLWGDVPEVAPTDRIALETAVSEVAANIVEHAARGEKVPMRLVLRAGHESVEAHLEDRGYPFVEHEVVTTAGDDLPEHGRGLVLARALTDALVYERDGGVNRWYLLRRRSTST
jgi:serine/threonine-protein kinase RsbW